MGLKLTIITILTLTICSTFGQIVQNDSLINKFVNNLSATFVDTILIYKNECVGCPYAIIMEKNDSCHVIGKHHMTYIFWRKNGMDYVSKISYYDCYNFDLAKYDSKSIWDLFFTNKTKIMKEEILPPTYIDKGKKFRQSIDHYLYSQIKIIDIRDTISFELNDFYFTRMIDEKYTNINYELNSTTFRKKLQIQIEKEIKDIENNELIRKKGLQHRYL